MCPIAHLKFNFHDCRNRFPVYVIHCENTKCEVVPLAIQLICSSKYDSVSKLSEIRDKIAGGKVCIVFSVSVDEHKDDLPDNEHSSDSDVPCTSKGN